MPKQGGRLAILAKIFANPHLPEIDDYYEPFTFDYEHLHIAPELPTSPVARPLSLITGRPMEKIEWGPNWEEILGGEFAKRSQDYNFEAVQKDIYGQFENTFMMYLPRLCEHCLNPSCVASCPSGSIYKREEDGIVLIDQDKCRGWRMCVSGCPYKKIYYNWTSGKAEKCIFCYPRIEAGQPTVCSETCVGRIRYLGVLLYDADGIQSGRISRGRAGPLRGATEAVPRSERSGGRRAGAAPTACRTPGSRRRKRSPAYKMAVDWKIAFPLHPEYRTLPMVWYVPPLSPIQSHANAGAIETRRRNSRRALAAHSGALSGQPADGGRRSADRHGAGAHAGDAHLFPPAPARRGRRPAPSWRRPGSRSRRSRRCTAISRSPTTRTASSFRPAIAKRRRTPTG